MADSTLCPKCAAAMTAGSLRERVQFGGASPYVWAPEQDVAFPLAGTPQGRADIIVYRCPQCGYLEMFAPSTY